MEAQLFNIIANLEAENTTLWGLILKLPECFLPGSSVAHGQDIQQTDEVIIYILHDLILVNT